MHKQSQLFDDVVRARQVLDAVEPNEQKRLGHLVKHFNSTTWSQNYDRIMYEGNYYKFTQNVNLRQELLQTFPFHSDWNISLRKTTVFKGLIVSARINLDKSEPNSEKK